MGNYLVVTTILSSIFVLRVAWLILYPYKCSCGYRTYFARAMFRHLATKHAYEK